MFKLLAIAICATSTIISNGYSHAVQYSITEIYHRHPISIQGINCDGVILGHYINNENIFSRNCYYCVGFEWSLKNKFKEFGISPCTDFRIAGMNNYDTVAFGIGEEVYTWHPVYGYRSIASGMQPVSINSYSEVLLVKYGAFEKFWGEESEEIDSQEVPCDPSSLCTVAIAWNTNDGQQYEAETSMHNLIPKSINDQHHILLEKDNSSESGWQLWDQHFIVIKDITSTKNYEQGIYPHIVVKSLNNLSDVLGYEEYSKHSVGVLWTFEGERIEISSPLPYIYPSNVNDDQQVVGYISSNNDNAFGHIGRAFVWDKENGIQDLNDCIPSNSKWNLTEAIAINDKGQIVGIGWQDHIRKAFLLTPLSD